MLDHDLLLFRRPLQDYALDDIGTEVTW